MIALQRTDEFVGRTTNWLYDHLRFLPRYTPSVVCDSLANRQEFADLEARAIDPQSLGRRIWRRAFGQRLYPLDRRWLNRKAPRVPHSHFGYGAAQEPAPRRSLGGPMAEMGWENPGGFLVEPPPVQRVGPLAKGAPPDSTA